MLAAALERGRQLEQLLRSRAVAAHGLDHPRPVPRQRAGLVEGDGADARQRLERGTALDQHARAGGRADRRDDGDRHRDRKRARCGRHQYDERTLDPRGRVAEQAAGDGDEEGGNQDAGNEGSGDALGQSLAVPLALLGVLDDLHDSRERVVLGARGDLDLERRPAVDGGGVHLLTGSALDRDRLAGDGGEVECRAPGANDTVGRDTFARLDEQPVAELQLLGGEGHLAAVTEDGRACRDEVQERAQSPPRLGQRVALQRL